MMGKKIVIITGLLIGYMGYLLVMSRLPSADVLLSPMQPRPWAKAEYDQAFSTPLMPLPGVLAYPPASQVTIEQTSSTEVKITQAKALYDKANDAFGSRVFADENLVVTLPNGVQIKCIGVAHLKPQLPTDPSEKQRSSDASKRPVQWYSPSSLQPIQDLQSFGLGMTDPGNPTTSTYLLAFEQTSHLDQPILWQSAKVFHHSSQVGGFNSVRWQDGAIGGYLIDGMGQHQDSIDIALSIAYGDPERLELDISKQIQPPPLIDFPSGQAQARFLFASNGYPSSRGYGSESATFQWRQDSSYSFVLFQVHPIIQTNQFRCRIAPDDDWSTGLNHLVVVTSRSDITHHQQIEIERFPSLAHCVFKLPNIPDTVETDDLLQQESGPITFVFPTDIKNYLTSSTLCDCDIPSGLFQPSDYPLFFESTTPQAILDLVNTRHPRPIRVDVELFTIREIPKSRHEIAWASFSDWIAKQWEKVMSYYK